MTASSDEARFREAYEAYHRHVYAYCRRRVASGAADCAADTFLVAWRRIDDVPDGKRALPWLYAVARRVVSNHRRSLRRRARLSEKAAHASVTSGSTPETVVVRSEEEQEVLDALASLRPGDQEVLQLAVWEELPHAEIGEILGCSAHAVDQRIYRASRRLARGLAASGHKQGETTAPRPSRQEDPT